jgi:hypothetical protein
MSVIKIGAVTMTSASPSVIIELTKNSENALFPKQNG